MLGNFLFLALFFVSGVSLAQSVSRFEITSVDGIKLDSFLYAPSSHPKGVILVVGGSGFSNAGFGGPSKMGRLASDRGYVAIEWNKRGLKTKPDLSGIEKNLTIYRQTTIENIIIDAEAALYEVKARFPQLPIYIVGGSEGSVVATRLAETHPNGIKAIATFGTVVSSFIEATAKQLSDQVIKPKWQKYDTDQDGSWSVSEYNAAKQDEDLEFFNTISFDVIDVTKNGAISASEADRFVLNHFVNEESDEFWLNSSGVAPGWLSSMFRLPNLLNRASHIRVPYLLAHGEEDWNTPIRHVFELEVLSRTLGLHNFSFRYFAKTGHAPSPEMFDEILVFFDSHR